MCRLLYTVLIATALTFVAERGAAQGAPVDAQPAQLRLAVVERELEREHADTEGLRWTGPISLFAVGGPAVVGGLFYTGLAALMAGIEEEDGSDQYTAAERKDVNRGLYIAGAGAVLVAAGAVWTVRVVQRRSARNRRVRALEQERSALSRQLYQPPLTRTDDTRATLAIVPLLSREAQGVTLSLRF